MRSINSGLKVLDRMLKVRERQQRIIPMINFTCNGSINKWIVAARWDNRDDRRFFPQLQIWRRSQDTNNMYTLVDSTPTMGATENTSEIYEFVPSSRLQFQQGDILGVFNLDKPRLGIYYVDRIGPANYYIGAGSSPSNSPFTINSNTMFQSDLPLIAVETSELVLAFTSSFDFVS